MTNDYIDKLLNEFDAEFNSLLENSSLPADNSLLKHNSLPADNFLPEHNSLSADNSLSAYKGEPTNDIAEIMPFPVASGDKTETKADKNKLDKLDKIITLATQISVERYSENYNPEICLANLLNAILADGTGENGCDNFFELLNKERGVELPEALTDFDFYKNNPYKNKAEKILSKIEAKKNKI
jgi:hypothetical protein